MNDYEKEALLEELMIDYGDEIVRLAFTYVKNIETAKDIVQNTFVKCYQHLDTFRGDAQIKTWLYRITINESKDMLKSWHFKMVKVKSFFKESASKQQSAEQEVMRIFENEQLKHDLWKLPPMYREIVYLHYFDGLSMQEIAELLEVSLNTAKTRLRRGKQQLAQVLKEGQLYERET